MAMLDKELLEVLACPLCKGELRYEEEKEVLVCEKCELFFEVKEGIPNLIPEEGKPLSELR